VALSGIKKYKPRCLWVREAIQKFSDYWTRKTSEPVLRSTFLFTLYFPTVHFNIPPPPLLFSIILVETLQKFSYRKYSTFLLDRSNITPRRHCTLLDFYCSKNTRWHLQHMSRTSSFDNFDVLKYISAF